MSKNKKFKPLHLTVICAFLAAISIVCGKYLAIGIGDVMRFSFENLPIIFAGFAFGPVCGAAVGVIADLVGCLLVGYAVNPMVTLGAAVIGALSGIYRFLPKKEGGVSSFLAVMGCVFLSHFLGSVVVKTLGLAAYYSMNLTVLMLWRTLNYLIVGSLECVILFYLIKNRSIRAEINKILPGKNRA